MSDRRLYRSPRPGSSQPPGPQRDRRVDESIGPGHNKSRATVDTMALRLQRLDAILAARDWEQLREWRLSQIMALGLNPGVE